MPNAVAQQPADQVQEPSPEVSQPKPASNPNPSALLAIKDSLDAIVRELHLTKEDEAKAAEETQRAKDDLRAQQDMALWALLMMGATVAQVFLSLIGIVLIWKTLKATRDAVKEAKEATSAANEAVTVTKRSAEQQLRAYVFAKDAFVTEDGYYRPLRVSVIIRNFGQTPASRLRVWVEAAVFSHDEITLAAPKLSQESKVIMELPPGGDCKIDISRNGFDREEMMQMVPDIGAFFLYGRLTYIDCFGQRYYGTFRYEHIGKIEGDGPVHMKASLGGNSFGHAH